MKRGYYKGFFTNGTVKFVGKINGGDKIYLMNIKLSNQNINENENKNENENNNENELKKLNYCYSKRKIDNIINFKSIEKRKMVCVKCNKKCCDAINNLHDYKTKSKKKSKGSNKVKKNFNEFYNL